MYRREVLVKEEVKKKMKNTEMGAQFGEFILIHGKIGNK